jgi:hypothetical protein
MTTLYMTEIIVRDVAVSADWYEQWGFTIEHSDMPRGFLLLHDGHGGRLALKQGSPTPGGITIHLHVDSLPPGDIKISEEGYRRVKLTDPDGYTIVAFEWTQPVRPSPSLAGSPLDASIDRVHRGEK